MRDKMAKITYGHRLGKHGRLRLGCCVAIFDSERAKILLMRREDNGLWCLPSGGMEPGESAEETAIREVAEETGLEVQVTNLIGVYSSPHELVTYADGNAFQIVSLLFGAIEAGGDLTISEESTDLQFVVEGDLHELPIMANHLVRIADAFAFRQAAFIR